MVALSRLPEQGADRVGVRLAGGFPDPQQLLRPPVLLRRLLAGQPRQYQYQRVLRRQDRRHCRTGRGLDAHHPAAAKLLWQDVDRRVTDAAPAIFTTNLKSNTLISHRVGNYTRTLLDLLLFDQ